MAAEFDHIEQVGAVPTSDLDNLPEGVRRVREAFDAYMAGKTTLTELAEVHRRFDIESDVTHAPVIEEDSEPPRVIATTGSARRPRLHEKAMAAAGRVSRKSSYS